MKKILLALIGAGVIGLTGCTTTSYHQDDVKPVPPERVYGFQENIDDLAVVKVRRLSNFSGSGCYYAFLIDDQRVARMDVEEQATFYLKPGLHTFQVTGDWDGRALCGLWDETEARMHGQIRQAVLKPGYVYDFRIGFNSWAGVFRLYVDKLGKPISQ